jgi:hypothetical protein
MGAACSKPTATSALPAVNVTEVRTVDPEAPAPAAPAPAASARGSSARGQASARGAALPLSSRQAAALQLQELQRSPSAAAAPPARQAHAYAVDASGKPLTCLMGPATHRPLALRVRPAGSRRSVDGGSAAPLGGAGSPTRAAAAAAAAAAAQSAGDESVGVWRHRLRNDGPSISAQRRSMAALRDAAALHARRAEGASALLGSSAASVAPSVFGGSAFTRGTFPAHSVYSGGGSLYTVSPPVVRPRFNLHTALPEGGSRPPEMVAGPAPGAVAQWSAGLRSQLGGGGAGAAVAAASPPRTRQASPQQQLSISPQLAAAAAASAAAAEAATAAAAAHRAAVMAAAAEEEEEEVGGSASDGSAAYGSRAESSLYLAASGSPRASPSRQLVPALPYLYSSSSGGSSSPSSLSAAAAAAVLGASSGRGSGSGSGSGRGSPSAHPLSLSQRPYALALQETGLIAKAPSPTSFTAAAAQHQQQAELASPATSHQPLGEQQQQPQWLAPPEQQGAAGGAAAASSLPLDALAPLGGSLDPKLAAVSDASAAAPQ